MNINKTFIQIAAIDALAAIVTGTLGAHIFKAKISASAYEVLQTGLRYQFYHLFAIALVGVIYYNARKSLIKWAGILFIAGTVLFCGSLYVYTYAVSQVNLGLAQIESLAPVGGFCLLAAWLLVIFSLVKNKS